MLPEKKWGNLNFSDLPYRLRPIFGAGDKENFRANVAINMNFDDLSLCG
jgi:hypothetical protein